jgi:hypothetical protein
MATNDIKQQENFARTKFINRSILPAAADDHEKLPDVLTVVHKSNLYCSSAHI